MYIIEDWKKIIYFHVDTVNFKFELNIISLTSAVPKRTSLFDL